MMLMTKDFPDYSVTDDDRVWSPVKRPIEQWKEGFLIKTFASFCEAGRAGFSPGYISEITRGKRVCAYGYQWKYADQ